MSWIDDNLLVPGELVRYRTSHWNWEYVITSRRLIAVNDKMIGKDVSEINLANVEYVDAKKKLLGSGGRISIGGASGNRDLTFQNVPNVLEFRRELLEAVDDRRG